MILGNRPMSTMLLVRLCTPFRFPASPLLPFCFCERKADNGIAPSTPIPYKRLSKMFYSGVLVIVLRLFDSLIREKDQATLSASEKHIMRFASSPMHRQSNRLADPRGNVMFYKRIRLHLSPGQFLPTIRELFFSEHAHRKRSGYRSTWWWMLLFMALPEAPSLPKTYLSQLSFHQESRFIPWKAECFMDFLTCWIVQL